MNEKCIEFDLKFNLHRNIETIYIFEIFIFKYIEIFIFKVQREIKCYTLNVKARNIHISYNAQRTSCKCTSYFSKMLVYIILNKIWLCSPTKNILTSIIRPY